MQMEVMINTDEHIVMDRKIAQSLHRRSERLAAVEDENKELKALKRPSVLNSTTEQVVEVEWLKKVLDEMDRLEARCRYYRERYYKLKRRRKRARRPWKRKGSEE